MAGMGTQRTVTITAGAIHHTGTGTAGRCTLLAMVTMSITDMVDQPCTPDMAGAATGMQHGAITARIHPTLTDLRTIGAMAWSVAMERGQCMQEPAP